MGSAVGRAEGGHILCAPCLSRWFATQTSMREESGLQRKTRRVCPVCQTELRATCKDMRDEADRYHLGLLKIEGTWD